MKWREYREYRSLATAETSKATSEGKTHTLKVDKFVPGKRSERPAEGLRGTVKD